MAEGQNNINLLGGMILVILDDDGNREEYDIEMVANGGAYLLGRDGRQGSFLIWEKGSPTRCDECGWPKDNNGNDICDDCQEAKDRDEDES